MESKRGSQELPYPWSAKPDVLLPVVTVKVFSVKLQILSLSYNYFISRKATLKDE